MNKDRLISRLAGMKTEEEHVGGMSGDDAVESLSGLIREARAIVGAAEAPSLPPGTESAPVPAAAELQRRLDAITARIDGAWENPALMSFGALTVEPFADVLRIARGEMPTDVVTYRPQASQRERG